MNNPHRHTAYCAGNESMKACCPACRWNAQQLPTPMQVQHLSFDERMTGDDATFLRSAGIEYLYEPKVRLSSDPDEPLLNFE